MPARTASQAFFQGCHALLPLVPGVVPFGLVTGVMAIDLGLSPWQSVGMALLFYSGSAQMAVLQLMHSGVAPVAIVFTALVINLRFVMYSATLAPHQQPMPRRRSWPLAYVLSDQSFALCSLRYSAGDMGPHPHHFYAGTAVAMWVAWQLSVLAGVFLGAGVPQGWSLSFAIPLSFLSLLIPGIRGAPTLGAALVGGLLAVLAAGLPYNLGLVLASLGGIATGLVLETYTQRARILCSEGGTP